jgi:hypothetical protein
VQKDEAFGNSSIEVNNFGSLEDQTEKREA